MASRLARVRDQLLPPPLGLLADEERVVTVFRWHWAVVAPAAVVALVCVWCEAGAPPGAVTRPVEDTLPAGILAALAAVVLAVSLTAWHRHIMVITDRRVLSFSWLPGTPARGWPLTIYARATYARGPVGRLLGYGSISARPVGTGRTRRLRLLPKPDQIYLALLDLSIGEPSRPDGDE